VEAYLAMKDKELAKFHEPDTKICTYYLHYDELMQFLQAV
jgi:hypothetical protein